MTKAGTNRPGTEQAKSNEANKANQKQKNNAPSVVENNGKNKA